eukprot:14997189-Alexandrium_andersonii.AAC.1
MNSLGFLVTKQANKVAAKLASSTLDKARSQKLCKDSDVLKKLADHIKSQMASPSPNQVKKLTTAQGQLQTKIDSLKQEVKTAKKL